MGPGRGLAKELTGGLGCGAEMSADEPFRVAAGHHSRGISWDSSLLHPLQSRHKGPFIRCWDG